MLQLYFVPRLEEIGVDYKKIYFQQVGAIAHISHLNMEVLCNCSHKLINCYGEITWPARSPEPSIPDIFLWGYLKEHVYAKHPQTVEI